MTVTPMSAATEHQLDLARLTRPDFPLLNQSLQGQPLVYMDHAATSQKPRQVIDALVEYYRCHNANVHRGAHTLSARATEAFESARATVARFVGAANAREIVFSRNATEAINLVAYSWALDHLKPGDEVVLSVMEHHSNLVPWQLMARRSGAVLRHVGITSQGEMDVDHFKQLLNERTRLVSFVHLSNTLGCLNPAAEITAMAHGVGARVLVDGCQALSHRPVDVQALGCDWYVGSGHKLCGPTGIGFLWGREDLLEAMTPFLGGGEMIAVVQLEKSTWAELPHKFEAGTPAIAEAIGLAAALDYLSALGLEKIHAWEQQLTQHLFDRLQAVDGLIIYGPDPREQPDRGALASFTVAGAHAHDVAALLDSTGICIRSGDHCTQPLHRALQVTATARASLSFTNTMEEIDRLAHQLQEAVSLLRQDSEPPLE
ncbi:MAG: cysteine desulfurase [Candidatus Synechococcus spongiarum 15L]|uniref:cysteine desulfurase n=1 Tax=Candidatus Synechococcus spongiarum 15L TaxID=1608419 RepID=A0A0G8AUF3_9SYNE|nr:MAG: cysteine desulfurase [Candidatus Synechococcus spongiarum 15L]